MFQTLFVIRTRNALKALIPVMLCCSAPARGAAAASTPAAEATEWQRHLAPATAAGIVEGDILSRPANISSITNTANSTTSTATATASPTTGAGRRDGASVAKEALWPGGVIPYVMDPSVPDPASVLAAMSEWASVTPVRFVKRTNQSNYVVVQQASSIYLCNSYVGVVGGPQQMNLGSTCSFTAILHELGHSIGLWHTQSRADRDQFVTVNYAPMSKTCIHNFDIAPSSALTSGPYDWGSVMQYFKYAFSANGQPTMTTVPLGIPIGEAEHLSAGDIDAVSRLYGKNPTATVVTTVPPGLHVLVDGADVVTPQAFQWAPGTAHRIEPVLQQTIGDARYNFGRWADADGDVVRTVTASAEATPYIAGFTRQYPVTLTQPPASMATLSLDQDSPDGYYPDGAVLTISASVKDGVNLYQWSGIDKPNQGTYLEDQAYATGPMNPRTFVVFQARTISAQFITQPIIRVDSTPENFFILVNGNQRRTPAILTDFRPGDTITIEGPPLLDCRAFCITGTRFRFSSWDIGANDPDAAGGSPADPLNNRRTIQVPSKSVFLNVNYTTEHQIQFPGNVQVSPASKDQYYTEGTVVTGTVNASAGSYLQYWQGAVTDLDLPSGSAPAAAACGNPFRVRALEPLTFFPAFSPVVSSTAAPLFSASGVLQAASRAAGGPVAPGMLVELTGRNLGPAAEQQGLATTADVMDNCAAGTRVTFDGVPAAVVSVGSERLVVAVPFGIAAGGAAAGASTTRVVVERLGVRSSTVSLAVAAAVPGVFTADNSGSGLALARNEDSSTNSLDAPAAPGSVLTIYATGLGATDPAAPDGWIATTGLPLSGGGRVEVTIGGVPAEVRFVGSEAGQLVSRTRIDVVVPAGAAAAAGDSSGAGGIVVPVVVSLGGRNSQAGVKVALQRQQ